MDHQALATRLRLGALFAALAALVAVSRPTTASVAIGAILVLLGESLRIWASGHLVKSVALVTSGPYRYCRHPLYLGRLLLLTGVVVAAWTGWWTAGILALAYAAFFGYYMPRKERVEGQRLLEFHGDAFREYAGRVPALLPRRRPWGDQKTRWSGERFSRNREVLTALALLLLFALLAARAVWI